VSILVKLCVLSVMLMSNLHDLFFKPSLKSNLCFIIILLHMLMMITYELCTAVYTFKEENRGLIVDSNTCYPLSKFHIKDVFNDDIYYV
jgi:hypothetical protein